MIIIKGELYSSKNSRRSFAHAKTGKIINIKSKKALENEHDLTFQLKEKYFDWEQELINYLAQNFDIDELEGKPNYYPLQIYFKICRRTKRKFDYINIIQNLCDCMVKAGWLPDDDANHLIPVFLPYEVDKNSPGVKISLFN